MESKLCPNLSIAILTVTLKYGCKDRLFKQEWLHFDSRRWSSVRKIFPYIDQYSKNPYNCKFSFASLLLIVIVIKEKSAAKIAMKKKCFVFDGPGFGEENPQRILHMTGNEKVLNKAVIEVVKVVPVLQSKCFHVMASSRNIIS